VAKPKDVMDRDLWLSSTTKTLDSVLARQADVDDLLRAATIAPRTSRRARAKQARRLRKVEPADAMAVVGSTDNR